MLKRGSKAAIVGCSNGHALVKKEKLERLNETLLRLGLSPVWSQYIYERENVFAGTGEERAESLMNFYRDAEIEVIFDVSGGDIANEVLPYLDFDVIAKGDKSFWGYSDLTTILNAIYTKTGKPSVLYQIKNLIREDGGRQQENFAQSLFEGKDSLYSFSYEFLQGDSMEGIVVGGNIRCLLKLAGTEYWPDMNGKILLLEAFGGSVPQMATYLNQLKQMGVFTRINGILLGTFTAMEAEGAVPCMAELVRRYAGASMPVAKTEEIGHGADSKAVWIGRSLHLKEKI